jgi:sulfoxide reductase heme-binding subunit YedZ
VAHIIIYFALRLWDFPAIAHEMVVRISLIVATLSTIGLIALGATSLDEAVRRMGAQGWNRLHGTVYVITGLAIIHYLLSPGVFPEQYLMSGMFFWLIGWRMLQRRGLATDARALAVLAVISSVFTALLEAGWIWAYHGYEPVGTLRNNFSLVLGIPPAWQILGLGLLIALAAGGRQVAGFGSAGMGARKIG